MTQTLSFKQTSDLNPALSDPATKILNADKLLGRWVNTNRETRGIAEISIDRDGEHLSVDIAGVGEQGPIDWPRARPRVFANLEEEAGQRAIALTATFNWEFMTAETNIRVNKGVLVIVLSVTFRDNSGRLDYVNREFFYRQD